ncbi:MAG TPA: VOC family protein [Steroidobacteraceae bacterium]
MAENALRGRFVWHELTTPNGEGAQAFYTKVLNWRAQTWEEDPSYLLFVGPRGPLAGIVVEPSTTPHWLPYISASDIEALVEQARGLGASVIKDVTSMPNGGKYAQLRDPQGAAFGVYASPEPSSEESPPERGEVSWNELATTDDQAAFDFYSALFGWESMDEHQMGEGFVYRTFGSNGMQRGGIYKQMPQMQGPPAWTSYVRVKDIEGTVRKAKAARAVLVNGPMEVPGGDWIAQFQDPYGAMFAIHALASDVKAAAPSSTKAASSARAESAERAAASKPAAKPKQKAAKKKAPAKKAAAGRPARKAAKKAAKRAAAKSARRPAKAARSQTKAKKAARKTARAAGRKRSGGKKRTAQKPRKGK